MAIDTYMLDIAEKEGGSGILAELALPTLDREFVYQVAPGKNGLSFLKIPEDYLLVGHSSGGNHSIMHPREYAESVFNCLVKNTRRIGAQPIAVADVIDARSTNESFVKTVGAAFSHLALESKVAILNGELAKLGPMVNCACNISGTMLGLIKRDNPYTKDTPKVLEVNGIKYFIFDPKGKFVWMNSDGTGTKPLINSRFGKYEESVVDNFAMQFDDKGKFGGGALASFNIVETSGNVPFDRMNEYAIRLARQMNAFAIMQYEDIGNRLIGPHGEKNIWNISGTLVSLVDEDMINNMPTPKQGDSLIAIRGDGRSNGFTDRRNLIVEWLGENWHETNGGKYFGEFLTKPSILFYPIFSELISSRLASSVYHMSGGAFRDKLSRPIARQGLYAEIGIAEGSPQLFAPDPREAAFVSYFNISNAYAKFAVGNEGFISTSRPEKVLEFLKHRGYESRVVGELEKKQGVKGVKLRAFNGDIIDFSIKS